MERIALPGGYTVVQDYTKEGEPVYIVSDRGERGILPLGVFISSTDASPDVYDENRRSIDRVILGAKRLIHYERGGLTKITRADLEHE